MNLSQFADALQAFAAVAAPIAITALWQGIVVATGLALCLRLAPRLSSAHRFLIWAAGSVAVVGLPFLPLLLSAGHSGRISGVTASDPGNFFLKLDLRWSLAIAALWIVASLIRAVDIAVHSYRLRKLWKSAAPVVKTGRWGGLRAEVCTTTELDRPSVIGFFAPRILIPEWLYERLTPSELDQVVLHEAEHLRRGDDWTNLIQKLCLVLFPLNPALWWIERQLCKTREMACDEGVIKITQAPRAYAACLTSLAERGQLRRAEALSLGAWQRRSELVARVHSILRRNRALHPAAAGALLASLGSGLFVVSLVFANCPQLVAFVPSQKTQTAALATSNGQDGVDAVYAPVSRKPGATPGYYVIQAKAVMPTPEQTRTHAPRTAVSPEPAKALPRAESAKTKLANLRIKPVPEHEEQQWIVLTSWEEDLTSNAENRQIADYNTATDSGSTKNPQLQNETKRFTVTRLVLKVLPPGSNSPQPHVVSLRDGWFVIQL
jgi:BlaR1 peptidase M56